MPTPFTHLETAQRLLVDDLVPDAIRRELKAESSAFLLGNVAADARTESGLRREDTHFYNYDQGITEHPWQVMMGLYPALETANDAAHRAFLAGYVAHLSIDEWWSLYMLGPHFARREWAPRPIRFLMLHILLIYMDERDYNRLESWQYPSLERAAPHHWLPFMNDTILRSWRDFIAEQISPDNQSQTLEVLGSRINKQPAELRAILDSPAIMETDLWQHIPQSTLAEIEIGMYDHARQQMLTYWAESAAGI
jgi:hypothetical protein